MPENSIDKHSTAIIVTAVIAALALLWRAIISGLGKFVLLCLRREAPAFKLHVEELFSEEFGQRKVAATHAQKALDKLLGLEVSVGEHGQALRAIQDKTGEISQLAVAIERMATAQSKATEEMTLIGRSVLRMEEREKMRELWDGTTERRERERRDP